MHLPRLESNRSASFCKYLTHVCLELTFRARNKENTATHVKNVMARNKKYEMVKSNNVQHDAINIALVHLGPIYSAMLGMLT